MFEILKVLENRMVLFFITFVLYAEILMICTFDQPTCLAKIACLKNFYSQMLALSYLKYRTDIFQTQCPKIKVNFVPISSFLQIFIQAQLGVPHSEIQVELD